MGKRDRAFRTDGPAGRVGRCPVATSATAAGVSGERFSSACQTSVVWRLPEAGAAAAGVSRREFLLEREIIFFVEIKGLAYENAQRCFTVKLAPESQNLLVVRGA